MLLGDKEARAPEAGEVMYKDDNGAICRRWNWREADRTKLTPGTTDAFFVIEALPSVDAQMVETAAHELAGLIEKYCGGSATIALVTKDAPEIGLQKQDKYLKLNPRKMFLPRSISTHPKSLPLHKRILSKMILRNIGYGSKK